MTSFKTLQSLALSLGIFLSILSHAENYEWGNLAIGGGGFVTAVIPSRQEKHLVYARTDVGGAYRWNQAEQRWTPLMDWINESQTGYLGVESLALDPKDPAKLYLMVGIAYLNNGKSAILRSNDYGKTFVIVDTSAQFKAHGNGMGRQNGERLQVDPVNSQILYAGTRRDGLFVSHDAGSSWEKLASLTSTSTSNDNGIAFVSLIADKTSKTMANTVVVGLSRFPEAGPNLFISRDAGKSFSAVTGGPAGLMPQKAELDGAGNLLVVYANGSGPHPNMKQNEPLDKGQLYKLNVARLSWENISPDNFQGAFGAVTIDAKNPKRVLLSSLSVYNFQYQHNSKPANGDQLFLSNDGGKHWENIIKRGFVLDNQGVSWIRGHAIHWAGSVAFDPFDSNRLWVTSGNGIFNTDNLNATPITWRFDVKGLEETVPLDAVSISGGPFLSAIGDYDGFSHTTFDQYSPIHEPQIGTTRSLVASASGNLVARLADKSPIYISKDKGATWSNLAASKGNGGRVSVSADGKTIIHQLKDSGSAFYTQDEGLNWFAVEGPDVNKSRIVADAKDPNVFYVQSQNQIYKSIDSGKHFKKVSDLGNASRRSWISSAPTGVGDLWLPSYDSGLLHSYDGGKTFTALNNVRYAAAIGFGKAKSLSNYPTLFMWGQVGEVRGLFRSTDEGKTWVRINDDIHQYGGPGDGQFVVGDLNQFGVVYMSTAGRGIIYGKPTLAE